MNPNEPLPDNLPDALHQIELLFDELERVAQDRDFYETAWRSEINAKFGVKEIPWDEINDILAGRNKCCPIEELLAELEVKFGDDDGPECRPDLEIPREPG